MTKEELGGTIRAFVGVGVGWLLGKGYIDDVTATALGGFGVLAAPLVAAGCLGAWSTWAKRQNAKKRDSL